MEQAMRAPDRTNHSEAVSLLSHRLRTPLTSIKSFSEILLRYRVEDSTTRNHFIEIIHAEADRLAQAIDELLESAHLGNNVPESGLVAKPHEL